MRRIAAGRSVGLEVGDKSAPGFGGLGEAGYHLHALRAVETLEEIVFLEPNATVLRVDCERRAARPPVEPVGLENGAEKRLKPLLRRRRTDFGGKQNEIVGVVDNHRHAVYV